MFLRLDVYGCGCSRNCIKLNRSCMPFGLNTYNIIMITLSIKTLIIFYSYCYARQARKACDSCWAWHSCGCARSRTRQVWGTCNSCEAWHVCLLCCFVASCPNTSMCSCISYDHKHTMLVHGMIQHTVEQVLISAFITVHRFSFLTLGLSIHLTPIALLPSCALVPNILIKDDDRYFND